MIGLGLNLGVGIGGAPSKLDAAKVALLGDSLIGLTWQGIIPDSLTQNGATFSIADLGAGKAHGLLEGGKIFGITYNDPANDGTRTVTTWTDALTATGTSPASVAGGLFHNLQRYGDWGSWASMWNGLSGWPVDYVVAAIGGALASQLPTWISTHVTPTNAGWVFLSAGRNDVEGADSAATIYGYLNAAVTTLRGQGRNVVICTIPPNDTAGAVRTKLEAVNTSIRAMTFSSSLVLLDVYNELDDGASGQLANGFMPTDSVGGTNIHPSPYGCYLVALAAQTALSGRFAPRNVLPTGLESASLQIVTNPTLTGTSGSTSGAGIANPGGTGVASNWTVVGSAAAVTGTCSKEARGDYGSNQVVTSVVSTVAGQSLRIESSSAHASFNAGDTIYGVAEISIAGMSAIRRLQLSVFATDVDASLNTAPAPAAAWGFATDAHTTALQSQVDKTVIVRTGNIRLTNAVSALTLSAALVFSGVNAAGTFKVGRAGIFKV
jgi:hypothetical protein